MALMTIKNRVMSFDAGWTILDNDGNGFLQALFGLRPAPASMLTIILVSKLFDLSKFGAEKLCAKKCRFLRLYHFKALAS